MAGGLQLALPLGEASPRGFPTVDADAFESDVWPLDREPYSSWVADRACRGEWSFLAFGDSPIKGEMKRYLVDKVNIKATSTAGKYSRAIGDIGAFVSAELEGGGLACRAVGEGGRVQVRGLHAATRRERHQAQGRVERRGAQGFPEDA